MPRSATPLLISLGLASLGVADAERGGALTPPGEGGNARFSRFFPEATQPERFGPVHGLFQAFFEANHDLALLDAPPPLRLCDIGAADGGLTAYLSQKLSMNASAYDVVTPDANIYSVGGDSLHPVELFDGRHIPQPDRGCSLTLFAYVLHHAANNTYSLLQEAARVTAPSGYVLITEDLAAPTNPNRTARNLNHDSHGIFRTAEDWLALLPAMGLRVEEHGALFAEAEPMYYFVTRPQYTISSQQPQEAVDAQQEKLAPPGSGIRRRL